MFLWSRFSGHADLLEEKCGFAEVVPVLVDVGQGEDDIKTEEW